MLTDHRLQIYLSDTDYSALKKRAREEGRPLASMVREAVQAYVSKTEKDRIREGYDMIWRHVGKYHDREGKTDVSERHDDYLAEAYDDWHDKPKSQNP